MIIWKITIILIHRDTKKNAIFLFYSTRLNKFLSLKNTNSFAFSSLNRNFALPLNKVGRTQEYKTKFHICFVIPLVCTTFAE